VVREHSGGQSKTGSPPNSALNITAADIDLPGTLNKRPGHDHDHQRGQRTIGLARRPVTLTISEAELANITANPGPGGTTTAAMTVDGISPRQQNIDQVT